MVEFDEIRSALVGPAGTLPVPVGDGTARKFVMLYEGECTALGPLRAAHKHGYSKQRYFQLRKAFGQEGFMALKDKKRGPKTHYRRTDVVVRQIIRYRFLDPDISADVIAQKLRQQGYTISVRSVHRVIEDYGLQKKTPCLASRP